MKHGNSYLIKGILMGMTFLILLFTFTLAAFAGCDLIVTDISWTPTNPLQGNEVTFKATVKNQGTSASPSGTILGVLFTVEGTSVNWSDNFTSSLAAGASTTVTATGGPSSKASWTSTWGSHTIGAYVDDINRIPEDNESNNNTYTEPLRIGMDLVVTDISWTPASPITGNEVTFQATIKNQGTQATPSGTILGVLFQVDGASVNWSDNYTTSLAGGASVTLTATGGPNSKATWTATAGTHTVLANVDDINRIGETDDGNNTYTESLTVATGPSPTPTPSLTPTPTRTPTPTVTPTLSPGITPTPTKTPTATATPVAGAYVEYEAESGSYTGALRGPGRTYRTVESESSGRKYVNLSVTGQYVQWTLSQAANSIVVRYNMPDASGGGGTTANLSLYVNGTHTQDLSLSSKYAWVYGGYPWDNNPGNGNAHRFYDETRVLLGTSYPVGTVIKLQKDSGDSAAYYNIDLIDMESVGSALAQPANSLSITSYGAVANDANDDTAAFNSVVTAAKSQGKSVWLPSGTFILNSRPSAFSGVTIYGAGMWYTVLSGIGVSFSPNGSNCKFYDFAMFGNTTQRIDSALETGFDGNLGTGSVIQNIWMEHLKCGIWTNNGTDGLLVNGCRIRNTFADGTNLYNGTRNTTVQNCSYRNTGDDSIAIWSGSGNACQNNIVQSNTVQSPYHANAIAVYGGSGNQVKNNKCYDTVQFGSGVYLANRFGVVAFSGTTTVSGNTLTRCGSWDNDYALPWGAIKLGAEESSMSGTYTISGNNINDCTYCGLLIIGPNSCTGATFSTINVTTAGTYGIEIRNNANGSATFNSVVVSGAASGGINNAAGGNFTITKGSGNSGW